MIFGQIREDLCESASKFFVGVSERGILTLPRIWKSKLAGMPRADHIRAQRAGLWSGWSEW